MHPRAAAPYAGEAAAAAAETRADPGRPAKRSRGPDDWHTLLSAVQARLREALGEWPDPAPGQLGADASARARAVSFDCADALDQLHGTLVDEAERCRQLERDLAVAHTKLRDACTELLGTQADERQARHAALHDSLTLLPNRGCFCARLDQLLDVTAVRRPVLALLYLDLDGFKLVNDLHGHEAGDQLLRVVATRLLRAVRADDMVSRIGGDEFACLLSGMPDRKQVARLAVKLLEAVTAPLKVGALTLQVRASIGIALCPENGTTTQALLKMADTAMYRAKRQQIGHAFYDEPAALRAVASPQGDRRDR